MKLAYIYLFADEKSSVGKKVISQICALNNIGISTIGLFFGYDNKPENLPDSIVWINVKKSNKKYFRSLHQNKIMHQTMQKSLIEYPNYFFYLRYYNANKILFSVVNKKFIIEIQSTLYQQLYMVKDQIREKSGIDKILSYLQEFFIPYKNEKKYQSKILNASRLITAPSHNILNQINTNVPKLLLTNGLNSLSAPIRNIPKLNQKQHWIFLKGNSDSLGYDGLERITESINQSALQHKIELRIAGSLSQQEKIYLSQFSFVKLLGYLNDDDISKQCNECHLGIGTLAAYKLNFFELSTLKVRDYFYRGLPFIYGYVDPDLNNIEMKKYCLEFSNDPTLLDIEKCFNFATELSKDAEHPKIMRRLAIENLTWENKFKSLVKFLN